MLLTMSMYVRHSIGLDWLDWLDWTCPSRSDAVGPTLQLSHGVRSHVAGRPGRLRAGATVSVDSPARPIATPPLPPFAPRLFDASINEYKANRRDDASCDLCANRRCLCRGIGMALLARHGSMHVRRLISLQLSGRPPVLVHYSVAIPQRRDP